MSILERAGGEIILGRVSSDVIYSTQNVLAKVKRRLKDTEMNVRLRPRSTIV